MRMHVFWQGAEVVCQRVLVVACVLCQVTLLRLARAAEQLAQRLLGCAQADRAQLIVIKPADGPRRLSEGQAEASDVHRGSLFGAHNRCIRS